MLNKILIMSVVLLLAIAIFGCVAQPSTNQTAAPQNETSSNISGGQSNSSITPEDELPPPPPPE